MRIVRNLIRTIGRIGTALRSAPHLYITLPDSRPVGIELAFFPGVCEASLKLLVSLVNVTRAVMFGPVVLTILVMVTDFVGWILAWILHVTLQTGMIVSELRKQIT